MEQSVTEGGCLAVTHARAAGRQPAFQVTSVAIPPPCPSQQLMPIPGAPTAVRWNSNYPGRSARSLRQQVRLVVVGTSVHEARSATYVDVHMDDVNVTS